MGALPCLRLCGSKINDIQLVEPPGLDPHIAVRIAGCHCHQIQRDRRRKTVAALMIRVVAAQLCTSGCRVHLHLPPGTKIELELLQRSRIAPALPLQHRRVCPIKCSKCGIPAALQDLFSELCTGGHDSSSLQNKRFCSFLPIVKHFGLFFNLFALKIQISASGAKNKMYFC